MTKGNDMVEIVTDERGTELLRAKCHGRPGSRCLDPRSIWVNAISGRAAIAAPGGKIQALGFPEEVEMVAWFLEKNGVHEAFIVKPGAET